MPLPLFVHHLLHFKPMPMAFLGPQKKDMGTKLLSKAFKQIWTLKFVDEIIKAIIELDHKTKTKKRKKREAMIQN